MKLFKFQLFCFLFCSFPYLLFTLKLQPTSPASSYVTRRKVHLRMSTQENLPVVVIGSGLAGLSCAAILSSTGRDVTLFESHYEIGGCAHEFLYTLGAKPNNHLTKPYPEIVTT